MKSPALRITIRKELFSISSLCIVVFIACLYVMLSTLLLNYKLLTDSITNGFPLNTQLTIIGALLEGTWTNMYVWDNIFLMLNALLVGINFLLIGKTIYLLEHIGKVKLSIGGTTLIALVTTGCASCGLSLLSIFGVSASFSFLPFHGAEIHVFTAIILFVSGFYMLKQIHNAKYCRVA